MTILQKLCVMTLALCVGALTVYVAHLEARVNKAIPPLKAHACGRERCDCGCKDGEGCRCAAPAPVAAKKAVIALPKENPCCHP